MQAWLQEDDEHICVLHCLTGKGRTCSVATCFLLFSQATSSSNGIQTLERVCAIRGYDMEKCTIPSQRRYVSFFQSSLHSPYLVQARRLSEEDDPSTPSMPRKKCFLNRVLMNSIPMVLCFSVFFNLCSFIPFSLSLSLFLL